MSWEDNVCEMVHALAEAARREQARIAAEEAKLTDRERDLRRRFNEALWGDGAEHLSEAWFSDPLTLLVWAQAYRAEAIHLKQRRENVRAAAAEHGPDEAKRRMDQLGSEAAAHEFAAMTMIALWLCTRGHREFIDHFKGRLRMPPLPPVPDSWRQHQYGVYMGMGAEPPLATVTPLFA